MALIERYIFRRAFAAFAGSLVALVMIVWIVQALSRIDIVKTSATAAGNVFWIALMLMPNLAAGVLPFAVLIGAVQALNSLNADSERAVIAASGASQKVVVKPILLLGLLGAAIILFNSHVVGPAASRAFQNGLRAINADAITLFLQPGRFERIQDGVVMSIGESRGSVIESLFVSDQRDPTSELTYFAKEARIVEEKGETILLLYDGQLHRKNAQDGITSVIGFQTYAFDLADLRPTSGNDWVRSAERGTAELVNPDINDPSYQRRPNAFVEELTQRMTDWLYPIAFALWAVVVAGQPRTNRQDSAAAMTLGLAGGLILKALGFSLASVIAGMPGLAWLSYALPLSAILLNSLLIRGNVKLTETASARAISGRCGALAERIANSPLGRRLSPGGPGA